MAAQVGLVALLCGCATDTGALPPLNTTERNREESSDFVLLDRWAQKSVSCSTVKYSYTPDGRLVISANIRNRRTEEIAIQVSCVFKDTQGVGTGDETPFILYHLSGNEMKTLTYNAKDDRAKKATIRVRNAM